MNQGAATTIPPPVIGGMKDEIQQTHGLAIDFSNPGT